MPDLLHHLQNRDLGFLRIVAEVWGLELAASDAYAAAGQLALTMLSSREAADLLESLPGETRSALDDLLRNRGSLPWAMFTRRHGEVREMGAGRREREKPHHRPISAAERLWYCGILGRAFFDTPSGPQEMAYLPDDFAARLPAPTAPLPKPLGRPASQAEKATPFPANDSILDHACTLLAALRLELSQDAISALAVDWQISGSYPVWPALTTQFVRAILETDALLGDDGLPKPDPTRHFLEIQRSKAIAQMARAWMHSPLINDLRMTPGLIAEGEWQNDPLKARYALLDFLKTVPRDTWWSLPGFVADIHAQQPDFQRPAGDYDSWYVRDAGSGQFLRGFEHWERVEGALLRYMIAGPLHWLGILDLAAPQADVPPQAFRFSTQAAELLVGAPPSITAAEEEKLLVSSDARLRVLRLVPRVVRYQIARFSEWEGESSDAYRYRLTPASLDRARKQGLRPNHLLALLRQHALTVPPSVSRAVGRWQDYGSEARLESVMILRVRSPEMLQAVRNSRAARFLGEQLGPTVVTVRPGAWVKVQAALAELGFLAESMLSQSEGENE
jgi:hypothetical protein